jgi:diketogulonate reductase-like aldo/keto reductase
MQYLKMNNGLPIPVLNQFLSYPGKHNQALIDFCKANAIISEAYQFIKKCLNQRKHCSFKWHNHMEKLGCK